MEAIGGERVMTSGSDVIEAPAESDEDLLRTAEAATLTPFKEPTLKKWRSVWLAGGPRRGPRFVKIESSYFYRRGDIKDWLRAQIEANES